MTDRRRVHERAVDAERLDQRILKNAGHQKVDLVEWIFDRVNVEPGSRILELCSGTGNQTRRMLARVGEEGFVLASDISEKALRQLRENAGDEVQERLEVLVASMDDLPSALGNSGYADQRFDLVFCAYGLYYGEHPGQVLEACADRLEEDGRIVVVGPFGPNNAPLFDLLERVGVEIGSYVKYTSQDFMEGVVIPFACRRFSRNTIQILVNPIQWESPDDVMAYWRNTTFYDESKESDVEAELKIHFASSDCFVNEKWIMLIDMEHRFEK